MDLGLRDKTVAVMAGSQGLGRAAAAVFAREGAQVTICARRREILDTSVAELRRAAPEARVEGVVADVTKPADLERFLAAAAAPAAGALDVLVCNSGGPPPKQFGDLQDADWQQAFDLLVLSHVRAVRAALPRLRKRGGAVVHITSSSVKQPIPALILSNSLRMAIVGLSKTLATELAPHNIRFNCVCPGSFATDRIMELVEYQAAQKGVAAAVTQAEREREIPMGRMGRPEELGEVIAFLASPRASYITGATVSVDGGLVRWAYA